jgi:polar amino acid transport system ATP-binding protein
MNNYKELGTILYVDKMSVGYGDKLILKDITIIEKDVVREGFNSTGQIIAILGRSGRGKSTLFKALTGLLKPTSGKILISDLATEDVNDAKEVSEGDIGFVNQTYTIFRHKTVEQIFLYAMRKLKYTKEQKLNIINAYIDSWGLNEFRSKYSCELSGGTRQRVAIIEQILTSKHFIILDEPASGLDVGNIEKLKESFQKISEENEYNSIIFSTHDINLAVELADSIYIIGRPENQEYSTVLKHYDLKEMGMAWEKFGSKHLELVENIKTILINS